MMFDGWHNKHKPRVEILEKMPILIFKDDLNF